MNLQFTLSAVIHTVGQTTKGKRSPERGFAYNMTQNNSFDLLAYLIAQSKSGQKNWFGFQEQRISGIDLAYKIAINHADKLSPDEIVDYVISLNNELYTKLIRRSDNG